MLVDQNKMRNIGISAHIDSGKTTLTERILFYTNRIHAIHEVKGKDGVGATMDFMELERERGITITSAATNVEWKEHFINIIDTPGHVDFTIEVERALRVLDGAILVLSGVEGVQSQSITVDRQLKRYGVPRIAFVNKLDRMGADPFNVQQQLDSKLGLNSVLLQIPIGLEDKHVGVVDLVEMKAIYFDGVGGVDLRIEEIPSDLKDLAHEKREALLDNLSRFSDELTELLLEEKEVSMQLIKNVIRSATIGLKICPVMMGSAYKNKGVQPLLDAILSYLPTPKDIKNVALDLENHEKPFEVETDNSKPTIALAFKLEEGQYGQLTYLRIYQGILKKGIELINSRTKRKLKLGRLVRMHANRMEDIEEAGSGDIVALFGVDCASGDTFCAPQLDCSMTSMFVPEPVISLSVKPADKKSADNMAKALNRFIKEDPTFRSYVDIESNETIIQGMGELHLDIYIERMKREYNVAVQTGQPQVAYRETITKKAEFVYTHKKQTGGAGQFAKVGGFLEPLEDKDYEFTDLIKGGVIPNEYIPSCNKGFKKAMERGSIIGFPVIGVHATINDGMYHPVDSSDMAFQLASIGAFKEAYLKAGPIILEPLMKVVDEGPVEFQGNILASLNQRRGVILASSDNGIFCTVEAEVPLSEMFGYSTTLRSLTQGKAEFTMEFLRYGKVPEGIAAELKKRFADRRKG